MVTSALTAVGGVLVAIVLATVGLMAVVAAAKLLQSCDTPNALNTLPTIPDQSGEELLTFLLADVTDNAMRTADTAVLYATRVLGLSLKEVADLTGMSAAHLGSDGDTSLLGWWPDMSQEKPSPTRSQPGDDRPRGSER